jgi:hypothetical protein
MPSKMNYRNEFIGRTEHLPRGYYWGCYTDFYLNAWKVDVWAISQEKFDKKRRQPVRAISCLLNVNGHISLI